MKQLYATVMLSITAAVEVTVCLPQGYTSEELEEAVKAELNRNRKVYIVDLEDVADIEVNEEELFDNHDVD